MAAWRRTCWTGRQNWVLWQPRWSVRPRRHGSTVLVTGEAGIGKTSLVRTFLAGSAGVRVLAGALRGPVHTTTPRPPARRGPIDERPADRGSAGAGRDQGWLFAAAAEELAESPAPTVLVIEDAHWADGATLDVLRYLGSRIHELPAVLVITFRDDALGIDHPLRTLLGGLSSANAQRLRLSSLSAGSVGRMAEETGVDADELFRLTGGNPFFVSEVLAFPDETVAPTIVDAVLARVAALDEDAQPALGRVSVVPSGVELDLLRRLVADLGPIGRAERAGVLEVRGSVVGFRHELARRAVAQSLPAIERLAAQRRGAARSCSTSRAERTRSASCTTRSRPRTTTPSSMQGLVAAREASRMGAHRQAARLLRAGAGPRPAADARAPAPAVGEAYSWALSNSNRLGHGRERGARARSAAGSSSATTRPPGAGAGQPVPAAVADRAHGGLARLRGASARDQQQRPGERAAGLRPAEHGRAAGPARRRGGGAALPAARRSTRRAIRPARHRGALPRLPRLGPPAARRPDGRGRGAGEHRASRGGSATTSTCCAATTTWSRDCGGSASSPRPRRTSRRPRTTSATGTSPSTPTCALRGDIGCSRCPVTATRRSPASPTLVEGRGHIGDDRTRVVARSWPASACARGIRTLRACWSWRASTYDRADLLEWSVPVGMACIENAWLTGRRRRRARSRRSCSPRTDRPGMPVQRGELMRYLHRLGLPVPPPPGAPSATPPASRATGARPPSCGRRPAIPTSRRSS